MMQAFPLLAVLLLAAGVPQAQAQPTTSRFTSADLAITFVAPPGCPTRDDLRAEIRRLLTDGDEDAAVATRGLTVELTVAEARDHPERATLFRGVLRLSAAVEPVGAVPNMAPPVTTERSLDGESCLAVVQASALVVALAVDPEGMARRAEVAVGVGPDTDPAAGPQSPTGAPAGAGGPVENAAAVTAPAPAHGQSVSGDGGRQSGGVEVGGAGRNPLPEHQGAGPRADGSAGADAVHGADREQAAADDAAADDGTGSDQVAVAWSLGVHGLVDIGTLPAAAPGFGLSAKIRRGWFSASLALQGLPGQTRRYAGHPSAAGEFWLVAARPDACWAWGGAGHQPSRLFDVSLCAAAEIGVLSGTGVGVSDPATDGSLWLAIGPSAGGGFEIWDGLRLFAAGDLLLPLQRPAFDIAGVGTIHRPAVASLRLAMGLTLRFP